MNKCCGEKWRKCKHEARLSPQAVAGRDDSPVLRQDNRIRAKPTQPSSAFIVVPSICGVVQLFEHNCDQTCTSCLYYCGQHDMNR